MKVLITGGMGVNGAVTARLMVRDGLRPVLMDNRIDLTLTADIKDKSTSSPVISAIKRRWKKPWTNSRSRTSPISPP